jgi:GT2 family glycosyltransferase
MTKSTMSHFPLVSIIIITWNSKKHLFKCLDHLSAQTFQGFEVIIVDNGSTDGSLDGLQEKHFEFDLQIQLLSSNRGFAAANNIGVHLAHGKWIALLNADAFPTSEWLENLIKATGDNPEYSCFSSHQIQAENPNFLDGAGDAYHVSGLAWKRFLGYPANQYGLEKTEVFSPCGAAALYLRQAFLDVGGFDDDFFSYMEDVDLGFRLRLQGNRCLYVPEAIVHHVGSSTFGWHSDFAFYHSHRNMIWIFVKDMPYPMVWGYLPAHIMANIIYIVNYAVRGRGKVLWQAKWDALKELPKFIRKRREIQKHIRVQPTDLAKIIEHGWFKPYLLNYSLRKVLRDYRS